MKRSRDIGELATALAAFQKEAESVAKGSENPFFKSKYAALPDVVKAASPILTKHGLSVSQLPGSQDGKDTLTTLLLHSSGQFIGDTMELHLVKDKAGEITPQAQGSAITYGRRYAYMAITGLVADEDDDGNAGSGAAAGSSQRRSSPPKKKPKTIDAKRLKTLQELSAKAGMGNVGPALKATGATLLNTPGETLAALTPEQADAFEAAIGGELLPANDAPLNG